MSNQEAFTLAKKYIPGGVNSPVRSFNSVGGMPFFTRKAQDCYLYDIEGNEYIDYVCSWGANIVGHAHEEVLAHVQNAIYNGLSFGTPTELETKLAKTICDLMKNIEQVRLVSSGTEAVMSAIRLARGFTGRKYIIKFNGCYHGHSDSMLVSAGSGVATFYNPSSSGVTEESIIHTIILEYNDTDGLKETFNKLGDEIACVIFEPYAGNMNLVFPQMEFVKTMRDLCTKYKALLIYDEVMTGFRVALNGAQSLLGINPDITVLGKIVGGGMPLAAFGGSAEIMQHLSPIGSVYQAGTLSGNPIAVTCGLANLDIIQELGFYEHITEMSQLLISGLTELAKKHSIPFCASNVGGMFGIFFQEQLPNNLEQVKCTNQKHFNDFFHLMLASGVFFAPSMYEAGFICRKHGTGVINKTLESADIAFAKLRFE